MLTNSVIVAEFCLLYCWMLFVYMPSKETKVKMCPKYKKLRSWYPLLNSYIGEIIHPGLPPHVRIISFFPNHKAQWTIHWFSKTVFCSTQYCIKLFSKEENEMKAAKLTKGSKQSDLKHHIYPQPLCLGNSGHMVCKWFLEILAKSAHDGIN